MRGAEGALPYSLRQKDWIGTKSGKRRTCVVKARRRGNRGRVAAWNLSGETTEA